MAKSNKPTQIANLLSKNSLLQQRILKQVQLLKAANSLFQQIVSQPVGKHCNLSNINNGVIVISADSPVWATRLRYEQQQLVEKLRAHPGIPPFHKLRIQVRPDGGNQNRRVGRSATPLSNQSIDSIKSAAEHTTNPQLKKALQRLALRASRRN